IVFGYAARPKLLARAIESHQSAIPVKEKNLLAVCDRRWGREITFFIALNAFTRFLIPKDFAGLAIQAHGVECLVANVCGRNKNLISQNNRCSSAGTGQIRLPESSLFRPVRRQAFFIGRAVEVRSAPLRPVFGACRGGVIQNRGSANRNSKA